MKRTHTETVEYFKHEGNTYRRFANGYWEFAETGESFCPPDGFKEVLWISLLGESLKNMEAIYQQPERCKSCKYYDENPYMHCAVHPNGPDGVCGDWEERKVEDLQRTINQIRPYHSPPREIPSYYFEAVELRNSRTEFRFTAGRLTEVQEYAYFNPITNLSFRSFRSSLIRPRSQDTQEHDDAELAFLQSCDRIIVRPEHVGIVFCKGLCDGQTLLVDDIIYFNSSQSAIAIERNGQLVWRSSE